MWTYAVLLYEVFWSCKVHPCLFLLASSLPTPPLQLFFRLIFYGLFNHTFALLTCFAMLAFCVVACTRMLVRLSPKRAQEGH